MTSPLENRDGSYGGCPSKPVHFFRIMLHHNLVEGNLRLPAKFVRKYGQHLSNTVFLKLPNGKEWKINLEKRDGSVWFQQGWKEFVENHSLAYGHLLVFKYDGTSIFHVFICDMSAMEIDYPVTKANHKRDIINNEEIHPLRGENKKKNEPNLQDSAFHIKDRNYKGKRNNIEGSSISNCGAHEAADNTSFTLIMKSSKCRGSMYLPKNPFKRYTKPGSEQYVKLLVGERSWMVKVSYYHNKATSYFTGEWASFERENDLKAGDACFFQLLNSTDGIVMKVSISRHSSMKS